MAAKKKTAAAKARAKTATAAQKKPKSAAAKARAKTATAAQKKPKSAGRPAPRKTATTRKKAAAQPSTQPSTQPLMKALRAEHRHMGTVMQLFSDQLAAIEAGELVDTHVLYEIMDYMVTWPDRFHHPREDLIYARVAELDAKAADEVDTLQHDHDKTAERGRGLLVDIERWRAGKASGTELIKNGREYIGHIYEHMNIEEKVVFPHIEKTLSVQDWRELTADDQLAAVADPIFGPKVQREFRNMTRKLRRSLRSTVERGTMVEWIGIEAFMESMEVVSMAYESAVDSAGEHLRDAVRDSKDLFFDAPVLAPVRVAANNARLTLSLLGEVRDISRETFRDLTRVNQERLDRVQLVQKSSRRP